jgi:hypothetical protein
MQQQTFVFATHLTLAAHRILHFSNFKAFLEPGDGII